MKHAMDPNRRVEAVQTLDGWYSLNLFYHVDWASWRMVHKDEQKTYIEQLAALLNKWTQVEEAGNGSHVFYSVIGQKADVQLWITRPTMKEIHDVQLELEKLPIADFFIPAYSYLAVFEASNYLPGVEGDPKEHPMVKAKIYPTLPKSTYYCFYPMTKKRNLTDNWYTLPIEERRPMMASHGQTGRKYAEVLKQLTSGSIGLDDWEWSIHLMGEDPVQFKKIVTEMRFDEASSRFGEFGPFYISQLLPVEQLEKYFEI